MEQKTLPILRLIKKSIDNYSIIEELTIEEINDFKSFIIKKLSNRESDKKDFVETMCDVFIDCIDNDEDIILPDVLENDYKESQIKQYINDLIEKF